MTDVRTSPPPAPVAPTAIARVRGPVPRRVRAPRWLDLRLVLGVLLVLVSVLVGARVVAAADTTVPVWAASGDLAAGTVLSAGDLVAVDVRLDDVAARYLATSTRPEGRTLGRAVRSGELLPGSALEEAPDLVQIALPVQAGFVPPGLDRGRIVDVYAVADPAAGASGTADGQVTLVVGSAPVQAVSGRNDGVLSGSLTTVQVVVSVAADTADEVLAAIAGRPLVVVLRGSVDAAAPSTTGTAPTSTTSPSSAAPSSVPSTATPSASTAPPS
ncbi:SAF domain-containing protein [Trujillonella endophytica]|uniref:Chaperone for flagella basal body P-ring formation n=1 Tax=Trujillonella endophytica TaxID=673521 RepID=A0A1H8RZH1_9ACTN|nr:SAF domain-containing protein [Trujillella endophytica]SEO71528.1 Chaperone for flagella basal body P-ring formation [Trujillella endophytica]